MRVFTEVGFCLLGLLSLFLATGLVLLISRMTFAPGMHGRDALLAVVIGNVATLTGKEFIKGWGKC